jgi:predicted dehydrogenase
VEVEDSITVVLRYDNGAIGSILASNCSRGRESTGNRIYGTNGQIILDDGLRVYTDKDVQGLNKNRWNEIGSQEVDVRKLFIESFARAILDGKTPDIPGEEGRKTLEVIMAAYKSAELHQPVELPLE